MRAVHLKCPNCGAKLDAALDAMSVDCSYCGSTARIQHRTRFLQRPVPLPPVQPRPQVRYEVQVQYNQMPVATATRSAAGIGWFMLVSMMATMGVAFYFVQKNTASQVDRANQLAASYAGGSSWRFDGTGSVLTLDIDGDGILDPIGLANNPDLVMVALNGKDGSVLWQSNIAESKVLTLHNTTLVQADDSGNISGWDVQTGKAKWSTPMGELHRSLCANGPDSIAIQLANKKWEMLDLATGQISPLGSKPGNCSRLGSTEENSQAHLLFSDRRRDYPKKLDTMYFDKIATIVETGDVVVMGARKPGTSVPMLAYYAHQKNQEDGEEIPAEVKRRNKRRGHKAKSPTKLLWSVELPSKDPLSADSGAPDYVGVNETQICSVYTPSEGPPIAVCFERATGKRMWESPLPPNTTFVIRGVTATPTHVFVTHWGRLDAFDAKTGALAYTIGS